MTRKPKRSVADAGVPPLVVDVGVAVVVEVGLLVLLVLALVAEASLPPWGNGGGGMMAAWERMPLWGRKPGFGDT